MFNKIIYAKDNDLGLVVNKLKDGVLKKGDNQVRKNWKDLVVDTRNGEGDDKYCTDR